MFGASVEARSILSFNRALFFSVWDAVSRVNLLFIFWENATEGTLVATNWGTISVSPTVLRVKTPEITTNFQELRAWESKLCVACDQWVVTLFQ